MPRAANKIKSSGIEYLVFSGFYKKCPEKKRQTSIVASYVLHIIIRNYNFGSLTSMLTIAIFGPPKKVKKQKSPSFFQKWTF